MSPAAGTVLRAYEPCPLMTELTERGNDTMSQVITIAESASPRVQRAALDLQRFLAQATGHYVPVTTSSEPEIDVRFVVGHAGDGGPGDDLLASGRVPTAHDPEGFALRKISGSPTTIAVIGGGESGAVYGTYRLLEHAYGCSFLFGSEVVPSGTAPLIPESLDVSESPAFATRGLLPWYDFLSGPTAWNLEDYKLYVDRMVRMGLNFLGLHVYSKGNPVRSQGAEPFLSFSHHGVSHDAFLDKTDTYRWGY